MWKSIDKTLCVLHAVGGYPINVLSYRNFRHRMKRCEIHLISIRSLLRHRPFVSAAIDPISIDRALYDTDAFRCAHCYLTSYVYWFIRLCRTVMCIASFASSMHNNCWQTDPIYLYSTSRFHCSVVTFVLRNVPEKSQPGWTALMGGDLCPFPAATKLG